MYVCENYRQTRIEDFASTKTTRRRKYPDYIIRGEGCEFDDTIVMCPVSLNNMNSNREKLL